MDDDVTRELCLSLMRADTEDNVILELKRAGFWEDELVWRNYGDNESNFSTIGNQQSFPDAALVEKLINAVDARLMNACMMAGIDPEGPEAPPSLREAVALFFENDTDPQSLQAGRIRHWSDQKRGREAREITLAATGASGRQGNPCFTVSDSGEGQTPGDMPATLLSLPDNRSNKLRVPFVQGKFNMGGTGALKFCGIHKLELVVSRRNPELLRTHGSREDLHWGFTVVRRDAPRGGCRSSVYRFLAPVEVPGSEKRGVLHFSSESMPIFPEGRDAYGRTAAWGTLIKLYEYDVKGYRTHILRRDGILTRMDLLMPDLGLPIRLYECRPEYRGHEGSFETTLTGLSVRLDDGKGENLESGFPASSQLSVAGEHMTCALYAFKKGRAETYRRREGLLFTVNGQTHGSLSTDFFRRKSVGLSYVADSLLVIVDCSELSGEAREDLFMNSRDRLSAGRLCQAIEEELEHLLRHHEGLRELRERRRREEVASRVDDSRPLEEVLRSLIRKSPVLSSLFMKGTRLSNPFRPTRAGDSAKMFKGKRYPSYFRLRDSRLGEGHQRLAHIGARCRVQFDTDACNDYLVREEDPGNFSLALDAGDSFPGSWVIHLHNGVATLSLRLPNEAEEGDSFKLRTEVTDPSRADPFVNSFDLEVGPRMDLRDSTGKGTHRKPPGKGSSQDNALPGGIQLPKVVQVHKDGWGDYTPPFDKLTALRVTDSGQGDGVAGPTVYDFFVNMDNLYLNSEMKASSEEPGLVSARFKYGMVLIGLAILQEDERARKDQAGSRPEDDDGDAETPAGRTPEARIEGVTRALAPMLLPMIDTLGALTQDLEDGQGLREAI